MFIDKVKPFYVGLGMAAALLLIILLGAFSGRIHNPPYEVIAMGQYDEIIYIGHGQFYVARGTGANRRWGVKDTRGNEVIYFGRYDWQGMDFLTHDGHFVLQRNRTFYIRDNNGRTLVSFDRYDAVRYVSPTRFIVTEGTGGNARAALIDRRGNYIVPLGRYTHIDAVHEGDFFMVRDGNLVGAINSRGQEIISVGRYDAVYPFPGNRFLTISGSGDNRRMGLYDHRGNAVITPGRFEEIRPGGDDLFIARAGSEWGVINARGNEIVPFRYDAIHYGDGFFSLHENNRTRLVNRRGNEVIPPGRYRYINNAFDGHFLVSGAGARWGVVDTRGNYIIEMGRYATIDPVPGNRFIVATRDSRGVIEYRGVIDHRGREIIPMGEYALIVFMHWGAGAGVDPDPVFLVTQDHQHFAYLDMDGHVLIPPGYYDDVYGIFNRLAIVRQEYRIGVINTRRSR